MSKVCSSCGAENVDEAKFCRKCGKQKFENNEEGFQKEVVVNSKSENTTTVSTTQTEVNDFKSYFFEPNNEPTLLFVSIFWSSLFAVLIFLEQHGIM
jgi:hypothetical protein